MKFFICKHCGNIIMYATYSGVPVVCCGEKMQELVAGTVEASLEKHIPAVTIDNNLVTVDIGSIAHPMIEVHHIKWVVLETKEGMQKKDLAINSEPKVKFTICNSDEVVAAYAYCNLHGLWKK